MPRTPALAILLLGLVLLLPAAALSAPEDDGQPAESDTADAPAADSTDDTQAADSRAPEIDDDDFEIVEDILREADEDNGVAGDPVYDPTGRRDPFVPLRHYIPDAEARVCPGEGVTALLIDDLEVEGIFVTPEGPVLQAASTSEATSFLLRAGDELCDGDLVELTLDTATFRQRIDDPTVLNPFREVVKHLQ